MSAAPPISGEPLAALALATEALDAGDWKAAETGFARVVSLDATSAAAEMGWARSLVYQYRAIEAIDHARRGVDLAPRQASAQATLALALDWAGDPDGAAAAARRSIDLAPDVAEGHAFLAETYADRYLLADAWRSADRAIALDPRGVEPQRVRAYLFETEGRYREAVGAYQEAISGAPGYAHLHFSLGGVYRAIGQFDEAMDHFRTAMTLAPSDARPRVGIALIYLALEDVPPAIPYLEEATQLDPSYATAQGQLGTARYFLGDYARAREPLETAIQLERKREPLSTYRHVLGWVYLKLGSFDAAESEFERALALNPQLKGAREGLETLRTSRARP